MTPMIPDAQLDALADEFIALNLARHGINLLQFAINPDSYRNHYNLRQRHDRQEQLQERRQAKGMTGRVDERLKHTRHPRSRGKSDFTRRASA